MKALEILYENDEILVIDKPAGLAVQGGERIMHSVDTVLATQTGEKVFPVHRLDKDTSGILVVAKSAGAAAKWTKLIASGIVAKEYTALCLGTPSQTSGVFDGQIGGKAALTKYTVLRTGAPSAEGRPFSLLNLTLETGRTHQIRIHTAASQCPIAADDKYGDFAANRAISKLYGIKKLQLTCCRINIPLDRESRVFTVPLPEHIQNAVEAVFGALTPPRPPPPTPPLLASSFRAHSRCAFHSCFL
jgi:23S rRNA pseudouridine955/2504/2580 synthase